MSPAISDLSLFAHVIQTAGIFLICILFAGLYRLSPRRYFSYWVKAWWFLLLAMVSLQLQFRFPNFSWTQIFYFWGEYCFALYLFLGALSYPDKKLADGLRSSFLLFLFLLPALIIFYLYISFSERFFCHAFVFSVLLVPSIIQIASLELAPRQSWTRLVPIFSLLILSLIFMGNAMNLFTPEWMGKEVNTIYIAYQSVFDVMIEFLLAFGLILLAAVNVQTRLKRLHFLLQMEKEKMALLAHKDPLTDCFNRHALNEFLLHFNRREGLLIMIDVNDLKKINDQLGHQAGDQAIQLVAKTIREFLRQDDYLFRFGGDEFLLISYGMSVDAGEKRMQEIQLRLQADGEQLGIGMVTTSWGIALFEKGMEFEMVMRRADHVLYEHKLHVRNAIK